MALHQSLQQKLLQKLSPQQIQLMKLLQVPTAILEQRIKEELEENPALEQTDESHLDEMDKDEFTDEAASEDQERDGSEDDYENIDISDYVQDGDEEGKGLQPDAIIVYPDGRKIIIDSKVSLVSWEGCVSAVDMAAQKNHIRELCQSVRRHVQQLSAKNYAHYAGALDYVLLFIPVEPAFLEALKEDAALWKFAYDKNIVLVSPNNLLAVLKIIASMWKVEQQNKNAQDIALKAGNLYDKFVGFVENFELVGRRVTEAGQAFDQAHKQLSTGRGNITNKIQELSTLGAKNNKQLPGRLLQDATDAE